MAGEFQGPRFTQDDAPFLAASKAIIDRGSPSDDITKAFQVGMNLQEQGQRIAKNDRQAQLDEAMQPIQIESARQNLRKQTTGNDFDDDTYDARVAHETMKSISDNSMNQLRDIQVNTAAFNLKQKVTEADDGVAISKLLNGGADLDPINDAQKLADLHRQAVSESKTNVGLATVEKWWDDKTGLAQKKSTALMKNSIAQDVYLGGFSPKERDDYFDLINNKEYPPLDAYSQIKSRQVQDFRTQNQADKLELENARHPDRLGGGNVPSQIHPDDVQTLPKDFPKLMAGDDAAARKLNGLLSAAQQPENVNDPKLRMQIAEVAGSINARRRQISAGTNGLSLKGDYTRQPLPEEPDALINAYRAAHGDPVKAAKDRQANKDAGLKAGRNSKGQIGEDPMPPDALPTSRGGSALLPNTQDSAEPISKDSDKGKALKAKYPTLKKDDIVRVGNQFYVLTD